MSDYLQPTNFEHTHFAIESFPYSCFYINNTNTLPHWHNHTEIVYIATGSCEIYVNGYVFVLKQGDLILVPSTSLHSITPLVNSNYYALVLGEHLMDAFLQDLHLGALLSPILRGSGLSPLWIRNGTAEHVILFRHLTPLLQNPSEDNYQLAVQIKMTLCQFFDQLIQCYPDYVTTHNRSLHSHDRLLKKSITYMQSHYMDSITLEKLSELCKLSEQHYSRLFKAYTGKTAMTYLTLLRLECAHKLLLTTDLPITQLPELTGFCNANYFSRMYKKYYLQTPSQSRKMVTFTGPS